MRDENRYEVIRRPIITEKGLATKEAQRTLVFEVHRDATKVEIREAVHNLFKVHVDSVHTANFHGKKRRRGRTVGYRPGLEEGLREAA